MKNILFLVFISINVSLTGQICVGTAGQVKWECWQNLFDNEIGELYALEYYPSKPDYTQTLYKLYSPQNFDNLMGGRISGFISVPTTDDVTFNITGDDRVRFYLSTNESPDNLVLQAYLNNNTNVEEHETYPEQTSGSVNLQSGNYYYFELIYAEGYGGDHGNLFWKTDNVDPNNWTVITAEYLNAAECLPAICPERGTPCDDGDGATIDDQEDGHCHCVGQKTNPNSCIGERFEINVYGYDTIPGSNLNDLYTDPDFPAMPNRGKKIHYFGEPWSTAIDSTGNLIQAFLTVPVSGDYKFNITGNNDCIFFLSSDETIENKQAHQILVTGSSDPVEHNKFIYQSTSDIYLEKDEYYYVELNHKESSYSEHFSVFWQTPFTPPGVWKRIPEFYFYGYDCEIACIPQGTLCDDGDPFTNDDEFDNNCDCVGVPCDGSDCDDPIASYVPFAKCDLSDQLDNRVDNNWLSCNIAPSPNVSRADGHWVMYDYGKIYVLYNSHVWNYNESGALNQGFQNVAIDYSIDGTNWNTLGTYNWSLADGSSDYSGFVGPDFNGVNARFVLISSINMPSDPPCQGIGKILIHAEHCPIYNQSCDDGDPFTYNDVYNDFCICEGSLNQFNACQVDTLMLGDTVIVTNTHSARELVTSENTIPANGMVMYVSGEEIDLGPGFEAVVGSNFEAFIEQCIESAQEPEEDLLLKSINNVDPLYVTRIADSDVQIIEFHLEKPGRVRLDIFDNESNHLFNIIDAEYKNKGVYHKRIRTKKLGTGVFHVMLKTDHIKELEKITVL